MGNYSTVIKYDDEEIKPFLKKNNEDITSKKNDWQYLSNDNIILELNNETNKYIIDFLEYHNIDYSNYVKDIIASKNSFLKDIKFKKHKLKNINKKKQNKKEFIIFINKNQNKKFNNKFNNKFNKKKKILYKKRFKCIFGTYIISSFILLYLILNYENHI